MSVILNQHNVVPDGHPKELGFPISYNVKNFTGKPLEELKYVVDVNIHRRHLDEYQKAEIALERRKQFTRQTAGTATAARWTKEKGEQEDMDNNSVMRSASADAQGITEDDDDSGYLPDDEEEEEEEARLAYQPLPLIESEPSWRKAHPSKSRN